MTRQKTKGWLLACACMLLIAACALAGMPAGAQTPVGTGTPNALGTQPAGVTPGTPGTAMPSTGVTVLPTTAVPPSATPTLTPLPTATATASPSPSATSTPLPSATHTWTPSPLPTATRTSTPVPAPTATRTLMQIVGDTVTDYWVVLAMGVGIVFLLLLAVLFMLARGGRKPMPPQIVHAFLISVEESSVTIPILKDVITIGRAKDCDVQITDKMKLANVDTISRHHARIEKRGERWVLIDGVAPGQPSANGVFVNDKRTRENFLNEGDVIRLGLVAFQFVTQLPQAKPAQGGTR